MGGLALGAGTAGGELLAGLASDPAAVVLDEHQVRAVAGEAFAGRRARVAVSSALDARTLEVVESCSALRALALACAQRAAVVAGLAPTVDPVHVGGLAAHTDVGRRAGGAVRPAHPTGTGIVVLE